MITSEATKVKNASLLILKEYNRAVENYSPMHSAHEGIAVIFEEVHELWEEVRIKPEHQIKTAILEEAVQVAAMALRFIVDICMKEE